MQRVALVVPSRGSRRLCLIVPVQQFKEHQSVLLGHLLRFAPLLALLGHFGLFSDLLDALDQVLPILNLALKSKHVARLAAPLDLVEILCIVKQSSVALGIAGARRLTLQVEESVGVALRVACDVNGWHIGKVCDKWPLGVEQVFIIIVHLRLRAVEVRLGAFHARAVLRANGSAVGGTERLVPGRHFNPLVPLGTLGDLAGHEGRARVRFKPRVRQLVVAISDRAVGTVLAHVLNVTVNSLLKLPVRGHFLFLLFGQVREGAASADAVAALDRREFLGIHVRAIVVPALRRLERIWSFRGLQALNLVSNLSSAGHDRLDFTLPTLSLLAILIRCHLAQQSLFFVLQHPLLARSLLLIQVALLAEEVLSCGSLLEKEVLRAVSSHISTLLS